MKLLIHMKNKKSMIFSAILRIVIAIVLLFFALAACSRIRSAYSNSDDQYFSSFKEFVNLINDMSNSKSFELKFKKDTAIVGFRKNDGAVPLDWKCYNCHGTDSNPTRVFVRPSKPECVSSACICLCSEGFKLDSNNKLAKCDKLMCESLAKDIKEITILKSDNNKVFDSADTYWKNGFLFANNDKDSVSGISKISVNRLELFVDNKNGVIAVCNAEMKNYNEGKFGKPTCTTPP